MQLNELFVRGKPIIKPVDTYTTFAYTHNLTNYRVFNLESLLRPTPVLRGKDLPEYLFDFISESEVLGIANIVNRQAHYIVFKSLKEKKFLTYGIHRSLPYGVGSLKNFQYGDPLIIVEGLKDRDALSTIYPYVIATQTAGIGLMSREILLSLTNNFILSFDNPDLDQAGKNAFYRERKRLSLRGAKVSQLKPPASIKDSGTLADWEVDLKDTSYLKDYYYSSLYSIVGSELPVLIRKGGLSSDNI